ncbi:MAG: DoxX family protein [Chlamydiae bacterium]|jgi:putative oxidoreductase|nr:DoxX family protein [Chlamydiota bacterium]
MGNVKKFFAFLGRFCISAVFLYLGSIQILDWQGSETNITNLICDWHASINDFPTIETFLEVLLPLNTFILILAILFKVVGALLILFSYHTRLGAFLLLVYLVPTTIFSYRFWGLEPSLAEPVFLSFVNHIAIIGGILTLLAFGSEDTLSKDEDRGELPFGKGL